MTVSPGLGDRLVLRAKQLQHTIGVVLGGNAFLPTLLLLATLISGKAALLQSEDIYLAWGILLNCVHLYPSIFRPKAKLLGMGVDFLLVLLPYALGVTGLFVVAQVNP